MIFRKPYAFLIKYFKVINAILAIISCYIAYRFYNIIVFFNDYIANGYTGIFYKGFSNTYISSFMFLLIILILIGLSGIILLFIYKKKPIKEYLFIVIYYIILMVYLNIVKNTMVSLEMAAITAETSRVFRDVSMILILPQIIIIIIFIFRTFGYNLKKFEFDKDIKEISSEDNEEFEFTFKNDGIKAKRTVRRFGREFIYYVKENKLIVSIIAVVLVILGIYFGIKSLPEIVDKEYSQNDSFTVGKATYNINDSIITNIDYKGDIITKDSYYVVLKLSVINNDIDNLKIDYNNFLLKVNDEYIYPITDKNKHFIDYASDNSKGIIKANGKRVILLVYKIMSDEVKKNYTLRVDNGSVYSKNKVVARFNYVEITPILVDKVSIGNTFNMGDELVLNNTNLGNTTFKIINYRITDSYMYEYEQCILKTCSKYKDIVNIDYTKNDKTLMVINYAFKLDDTVPYYESYKSVNSFANHFLKVKYTYNKEEKIANVSDVTPEKLKDKLVLQTTKEIKDSSNIYLTINVRNKEYLIKLK